MDHLTQHNIANAALRDLATMFDLRELITGPRDTEINGNHYQATVEFMPRGQLAAICKGTASASFKMFPVKDTPMLFNVELSLAYDHFTGGGNSSYHHFIAVAEMDSLAPVYRGLLDLKNFNLAHIAVTHAP